MSEKTLLPLSVSPLPNGAQLYHICNNSKLTRIQAVIRTGSIHEGDDLGCGLSHFLEHMLFQGCSRYPGNSASDKLHTMGGDCNAYTTFDHTAYYAEVPQEKFAEAGDIICNMISEPLFPEEKFVSEKNVIAREADMINDRPSRLLFQQLWSGIFFNHPAGLPIIGFPDKIAGVSREMMQNYYRRRYGAARTYILVSGDLDTDYIQDVLSEKLATFQRGNLAEPFLPEPLTQSMESRLESTFADPLARLAVGVAAPRSHSRVTPALDLLMGIIGGSDSSPLQTELIYRQKIALSASSEYSAGSFGSALAATAVCEAKNIGKLEKSLAGLLKNIRRNGISAAELEREKMQQQLTMYQLLKNSNSAMNLVNSMIINFNVSDVTAYLKKLQAVTVEEINAAAEEYLAEDHFFWSKVVPEKAVKKSVASSGKTEKAPTLGKLANSCSYVFIERTHIPLDSLAVVIPAGPVWENGYNKGISQLLSKMLASGYDGIAEEKFYDLCDKYGIDLDVSCGNNTLSIEMSFPPKARKHAEKILEKILTSPRREKDIFERVRKNLAEQLQSKLMDPNFCAIKEARKLIFGSHVAGNSKLDSVEALEAITLEELHEFYFSRFDRNLVNFGSTVAPEKPDAHASVIEYLEKLSNSLQWSNKTLSKPLPADKEILQKNANCSVKYIDLPREQSCVVCAVAGGFAHCKEYYALLIMDAALNGLSSKLFKEVREKRSLAYSTGVLVNCGLVQGLVALYAGVQKENANETLSCLQNELQRIIDHGLDREEFASAQLATMSSLARLLESPDSRLLHAQLAIFYGDDPAESLKCSNIVKSMTVNECNDLLREVLTRSPAAYVIAGQS